MPTWSFVGIGCLLGLFQILDGLLMLVWPEPARTPVRMMAYGTTYVLIALAWHGLRHMMPWVSRLLWKRWHHG